MSLRITVLAGGPGAEREVSLASGAAITAALRQSGHTVTQADIGPGDLAALDLPADVVFPALHGTFGEDGHLQAELARRGLKFVGSEQAASALAIDKVATKRCAEEIGLRTPAFEQVTAGQVATLAPPCVVKPVAEGSSVLLAMPGTVAERDAAVAACVQACGAALVEARIVGPELTCGLLDRRALPVIQIRPEGESYDFAAKYETGRTQYLFDTLPADVQARVQADSLRLVERIGTRHLARVDWMLDADQQHWLLEVNTLPGFTASSLLPKAAARVGISFVQLCDQLARMPLEA